MYTDSLHEAIEAWWIEHKAMRRKERELQRNERKRELEIAKKETLEREAKLFLQHTKVTYSGNRNPYRIKCFAKEIL